MTSWDGSNRRKFPRVNYPCLITLRTESGKPEVLLTHTENIGIGGLCVTVNREIKMFLPVTLEIDLMDTENHVKCQGRVVWSIQRKSTEKRKPLFFDTGIEFDTVNDNDRQRLDDIVKRLVKQGHQTPYNKQ